MNRRRMWIKILKERYFWFIVALGIIYGIFVYLNIVVGASALFVGEWNRAYIMIDRVIFLVGVLVGAWRFAFRGGVIATVAFGLIMSLHEAIQAPRTDTLVGLAAFIAFGILLSWLIGGLKKAKEQLKVQEENFQTSMDNSPLGVRIITAGGNTLYSNRALLEVYGYDTTEELDAVPMKERYTTESYAVHLERVEKRKRGELVPQNYELSIVRKDGEIRRLEVFTKEVLWDGKRQFQVIYTDVTERKKSEEALKESEAKYSTLVEKGNDGIVIILDGLVAFANRTMVELTGFSLEESMGKPFIDFIAPEERNLIMDIYRRRMSGGKVPNKYESSMISKRGERLPVEFSASVIEYKGKLADMAIVRDITERRQAEAEIKNLAKFPSENPNPILRVDKDGTVIYANKASTLLLKVWGCQVGQPLPANLRDLVKNIMTSGKSEYVESSVEELIYLLVFAPITDAGYTNLYAMNITERKRAEEALKENEERYRNFIESTHEIIQSVALDGRFLFVNKAWHDILGYSEEDLKHLTLFDIIHPDSLEHCSQMFRQVMSGRSVTGVEAKFRAKNGSVIYVEGDASPRYLGGKLIATQGFFRDTTEHKRAEEKLKESEEFNSSLLEGLPNIVLAINPDTSVRYANPAFEKLTGFSGDELIGKKAPYPWWPEEKHQEYTGNFRKSTLVEEEIQALERQFFNKSGEPFWVQMSATYVNIGDKEGYRLTGWVDITERKKAENALKDSEIQYRRLFEAARDGILILNADTGQIADVNPYLVEMLGFSREEFVGKKIWELGLLKDIITNQDKFMELQQKGYVRYEGLPLETASGQRLEVEFVSNVYEVDHHQVIQCNIRDITERKKAEKALKEAEEFSHTLLEEAPNPVVALNPDASISYVNPAVERLTGYPKAELLGKKAPFPWWLKDRQQEYHDVLLKSMTVSLSRLERLFAKKTGELFWVEINQINVNTLDNKPKLFITNWVDITERKLSEQVLLESEECLREAQRMGKIGNWEYDITTQKIIWSDETFELYERDKAMGPPSMKKRRATTLKMRLKG